MNSFALSRAKARRRMAPAPALTNISSAGVKCSIPKMTDNATAPAAAANAKSQVGAGGAREINERDLAVYVANKVGRENAPKYIQVVSALPRNAAGHVRTDILQLVATNQVDGIDPLITSDAERATVERILNARHNMRDRFVL